MRACMHACVRACVCMHVGGQAHVHVCVCVGGGGGGAVFLYPPEGDTPQACTHVPYNYVTLCCTPTCPYAYMPMCHPLPMCYAACPLGGSCS